MRWQEKLTKGEFAHMRELGGRTLAWFKRNRRIQRTMRSENEARGHENPEPCWECRRIAWKLGLED